MKALPIYTMVHSLVEEAMFYGGFEKTYAGEPLERYATAEDAAYEVKLSIVQSNEQYDPDESLF